MTFAVVVLYLIVIVGGLFLSLALSGQIDAAVEREIGRAVGDPDVQLDALATKADLAWLDGRLGTLESQAAKLVPVSRFNTVAETVSLHSQSIAELKSVADQETDFVVTLGEKVERLEKGLQSLADIPPAVLPLDFATLKAAFMDLCDRVDDLEALPSPDPCGEAASFLRFLADRVEHEPPPHMRPTVDGPNFDDDTPELGETPVPVEGP